MRKRGHMSSADANHSNELTSLGLVHGGDDWTAAMSCFWGMRSRVVVRKVAF